MTFRIISAGGLGDGLLLTPALRALKQLWPKSTIRVYCVNPGHLEIFKHNPYIDVLRLATFPGAPFAYMLHLMSKSLFLSNASNEFRPVLSGKHVTEAVGELININVEHKKLDVFLTRQEEIEAEAWASRYRNPVALHITSSCSSNQHWPKANWEELVRINPQFTFLQLGSSWEMKIDGAVDLRGRTTVRQSIAILKYVKGFVGVVSFLSHATSAAGTPGVVLFGPSAPHIWGHSNNVNLTRGLPCSPCIEILHGTPCPYGAPCMSEIAVKDVSLALRAQVAVRESPSFVPLQTIGQS